MHYLDRELQLQLDVRQPVIEIEQRRVHLRFSRSPLKDKRNINLPSSCWRRLRIVRNKWRTGLRETDIEQRSDAKYDARIFNQRTTSERLFDLVAADLRWLTTAVGNSNKESVSLGQEKSGARAVRSRDFCQSFVVVYVSLLNDIDLARATDRVDAMALTVVENSSGSPEIRSLATASPDSVLSTTSFDGMRHPINNR